MSSQQAQGKYLLAEGLNVTIYERKLEVGGLWNSYHQLFLTNAYDDLKTNFPRRLMTFAGRRWRKHTPIFPPKDDVAGYLQSLAAELLKNYPERIQLQRRRDVIDLRPASQDPEHTSWQIVARDREIDGINREMNTITYEMEHFDWVVVSNGIYTKEFIPPSYEGDQDWRLRYGGTESHTPTFRNTSDFQGKSMLVVGNSASGWDISKKLAGVASSVTVSTTRAGQPLSASYTRQGPIQAFLSETGEVEFEDGTCALFAKIIWCTRYTYDVAFIKNDANSQVFTEDFRVKDTYEHMFYIPQQGGPSLAFVGLVKMVPWTVLELQGSLVAKVSAGKSTLHPEKI